MSTSESYPREAGSTGLPIAAGLFRSSPAATPPKLIDKLFRYLTDRFRKPAVERVSQPAMIVNPVRIQRLIALLARSPIETDHGPYPSLVTFEDRPVTFGLSEGEPQCFEVRTKQWRGSARKKPQVCGKNSAVLFDVEGLITWLREQFPRSTMHHVEARTGIPAASVENWLHRRSQPSVEHFTIMLTEFGPAFLHACLRRKPEWVQTAAQKHRAQELDQQIADLQREKARIQAAAGEGR